MGRTVKKSLDEFKCLRKKVEGIFHELVGDCACNIFDMMPPSAAAIAKALKREYGTECAQDIGFHLADWADDAAFLVALHLCPERFSSKEVDLGVGMFLGHAPSHIAAAAKLSGQPIQDVFGLGNLVAEIN